MNIQATISVRAGYFGKYLSSAARFARLAAIIESEEKIETLVGEIREEYEARVQAAVFFSVASLEACINELYADAREKRTKQFGSGLEQSMGLLAEIWNVVDGPSILPKYQAALTACEKPAFDKGISPYQETADLVFLRNALVHFVPEWDTKQTRHKKVENRLQGYFKASPFFGEDQAFFPWRCLGHGCAAWSVKTIFVFVTEFFNRLGIKSPLESYAKFLSTDNE